MKSNVPIPPELNSLARKAVDAAFAVHSALGPGLLEGIYESCLFHELTKRGLKVERQVNLPVIFDGLILEEGLRLDMLVEDTLVLELKAVEVILPVHLAIGFNLP